MKEYSGSKDSPGPTPPDETFSTPKAPAKKGVVYTCLTGNYDVFLGHEYLSPDWDYVCLTDNLKIKQKKVNSWEIRPLLFAEMDAARNQRWHKMNPHVLFPEYKRSIYIDSNIDVLSFALYEDVEKLIKNRSKIAAVKHLQRDCLYMELDACVKLEKDVRQVMVEQERLIRQSGFPEKFGLYDMSVIYREHNDPEVAAAMEDWWWWIRNHSRRDQLSFMYVIWKRGMKVTALTEASYRNKDGRMVFNSHNTPLQYFLSAVKTRVKKIFGVKSR